MTMSREVFSVRAESLVQHEGPCMMSAATAMLKGVLESEIEVAVIAGTENGGFEWCGELIPLVGSESERSAAGTLHGLPGSRLAGDSPRAIDVLNDHGLRLHIAPSAARALFRATQAARSGKGGLALIGNSELDGVIGELSRLSIERFERGSLVVLIEDAPSKCPGLCPLATAMRLNIPCVQPSDLQGFYELMDSALRLCQAGRGMVAIVVNETIVRSIDTLNVGPNRIMASVEAMLARRKRAGGSSGAIARSGDGTTLLRAGRRLELNRFRAVPNPGERVAVGFITSGPSDASLEHITHVLGLHGRVPCLCLGLIHPLDDSAVGRMLTRCQRVIVLETRQGTIESAVLAVAEEMRHAPGGTQPATIWGRELPVIAVAPTPTGLESAASEAHAESSASHPMPSPIPGPTFHHLHPSILVRRIAPVLHALRPTAQIAGQLVPDAPITSPQLPPRDSQIGSSAALLHVRRVLTEVDQVLREEPITTRDGQSVRTALAVDGAEPLGSVDRIVHVETWDHKRFLDQGLGALAMAAADAAVWMYVICESTIGPIRDLERMARGAVPQDSAGEVTIHVADINDRAALKELMRTCVHPDRSSNTGRGSLAIIIVRDGPPARFDAAAAADAIAEIDRLGFEPRQRLVRSADDLCAIRIGDNVVEEVNKETLNLSAFEKTATFTKELLTTKRGSAFSIHVRPLLEEVEVIRIRPPLMAWQGDVAARMPTPTPIHAKSSLWRVHLAGYRRRAPGLATSVLCEAGRLMGYRVRCLSDSTPIAPGRNAWAQVSFSQQAAMRSAVVLTTTIPFGEADLLLGLDAAESVRAVSDDPMLRVASPDRTCAVVNLEQDADAPEPEASSFGILYGDRIRAQCRSDSLFMHDFSGTSNAWFHTDRIADLAMVGAAFQRGYIPVTLEALRSAVASAQSQGMGRSLEAFEFGRRLAVDPTLFQQFNDEREVIIERLVRRIVLSLSRGEWGGGSRARNFQALLRTSLDAMPGLAETRAGRLAREEFVLACHRCRIWGGFEYARRYADLITRLYQSDRGDTGRLLTRDLVLPLAEVMLIRDPVFIAGMANSSEQRRSLRQLLNVKLARGDRMERRYLTRIDCVAFNSRFRVDLRTSDWPAKIVSSLRRVIPLPWRGTRRNRELREYLIDYVKRMIAGAGQDYDRWVEPAERLHHHAADGRLQGAAVAEIKMLTDAAPSNPSAVAVAPLIGDAN